MQGVLYSESLLYNIITSHCLFLRLQSHRSLLQTCYFTTIINQEIHGDLFDVDDEKLEVLDALEDHPYFYRRTTVSCILDQGTNTCADPEITGTISCEVYLMHNFRPELLSLPHISSYTNTPENQYVRKDCRDSNFNWYREIKAQSKKA